MFLMRCYPLLSKEKLDRIEQDSKCPQVSTLNALEQNKAVLHTVVDVNLKTGTGTFLFKAWEGYNIKTAKDLLLIKLNEIH